MEITSLLFDLNYKFDLIGASLLALAKSIYYIFCMLFLLIQGIWVYQLEISPSFIKKETAALQKISFFADFLGTYV